MENLIKELNNDFEVVDNFYGFVVIFGFKHKNLDNYIIPDGVNIIGDKCFENSKLVNITIPNSVSIIGKNAFEKCNYLKEIIIPDSVKILENESFIDCNKLEKVFLSNNLTKLGNGAFANCNNINEIKLPGQLQLIGINSFTENNKINKIVIDEGIKALGSSRFVNISCNIDDIYLPSSIKKICDKFIIFNGDFKINNIYYNGLEDEAKNIEILDEHFSFNKVIWHYKKGEY